MSQNNITLAPLQADDREQFITDNQWAFKYGAQQEFGRRGRRWRRNIHFYVNRCGFHIVEFWNKYQHGPAIPEEEAGNWNEDDEMFVFRKVME